MITKEQLVKIREFIACPQFGDKNYGKWGALSIEQREAYLQLIEAVEYANIKWKNVKDELPKKHLDKNGDAINYLVIRKGYECAQTAYFSGRSFYVEGFEFKDVYIDDVVYWQEMPEAPIKEGEQV